MEFSNLDGTVSALEVFSPEKIIKTLQEKEDCSEDLIEIIKTTRPLQLKKLSNIFLKIQNFDVEKIIELTVTKTRIHRFNATYLVFSLIKSSFLNSKMLDRVEILFQSVYISRFKDIDPSIRAMCVQFLSEWAYASSALRNPEYLKYIGWALNDRNDSVRRRAVRSFIKLSKFCKSNNQTSVEKLVEKYKARLIEISLLDCNTNIQKDACKAILSIFFKNETIFNNDEILSVISNDDNISDVKHIALKKICPEGIWDLDTLHTVLEKTKPFVFKNLKLTTNDIESFILNICEFIKNRSNCCNKDHICFLDILPVFDIDIDPEIFINLLETVKDNNNNIKLVVNALSSVSSFSKFPGSTFKVLEYLRKLIKNNGIFINEFTVLLKKLEDIYSLQVEAIISELKDNYPYPLIKFFDISNDITNSNMSSIVKCYSALWKILKEDYEWVNNIEFNEEGNIQHYLELIDFIVFFNSKLPNYSSNESKDPFSCSKVIFDKLIDFITKNFHFNDQESCIRLYKLISIGQFTYSAKLLFENCSEELLSFFIDDSKEIRPLVLGYLEFLEDQKIKKYPEFSKKLALKINKNESDRYFFGPIRRLVTRTDLLDSVLLNFVPCFNINECIVLENLAPKSKFKTQLLKKCKSSKANVENVTFI